MSLVKCPNCGKEVSTKATNCPQCGCELNFKEMAICPECGLAVEDGAEKCPNCGSPIEHKQITLVQKEWGDDKEESQESIAERFDYLNRSVFFFIVSIVAGAISTYYDILESSALLKYDEIFANYYSECAEMPSAIERASVAIALGMSGMVLLKSTYRKKNICLCFILFILVVLDYLLSVAEDDEILPLIIKSFDGIANIVIASVVGLMFWQKSEYYLARKFGQYQVGVSIAAVMLFVVGIAGYPEYLYKFGGVLDILDIFSYCFIGFISWSCTRSYKKTLKAK
jgi:hypothetical protein